MLDASEQKSFEERFTLIRTLEKNQLLSPEQSIGATITTACGGSFFTCMGQTFFVKQISRYQETSEDYSHMLDYEVHELTCLCMETGKTVYFEWEYDDELEVTKTIESIKFSQLTDDNGEKIDHDDLDQIVEDEDMVIYQGKKFWYEDDWAAIYQREETSEKKEPVYFYEFQEENQPLFLTIERWAQSSKDSSHGRSKKEYQIFISQPVSPGEITLITKGAK